ncbi:Transmembrane amino acid transporter family protein [Moelleriella libera RCEF 2490]|uniref:Transmembrane amino acid transporter family protein n=1 Tax=Moelleriella libera RCEF 2490 TaxID=1081109 RepID=A0A168B8S7_9HYPO|nr:Transmembrane amino acid transporter family protein [Moelleriella libera RCEF 2490]
MTGAQANGRPNGHEEGQGLLARGGATPDAEDDVVLFDSKQGSGSHMGRSALQPPGSARKSPRTPNRVQFDLNPAVFGEPERDAHHNDARTLSDEGFEFDDDDYDDDADVEMQGRQAHRVPLLTDLEAPSVAVANTLGGGRDDEGERLEQEMRRPKSGLKSAFMNMANSIIGAGIIGQPYAIRQAGLLAGVLLLVGLTAVVDWTICLIVINSKLSGTSSFQGTVEHCFGRPGLIAISAAQWVFAFGGMVAFGVIVGDTIPHVLLAIWPSLGGVPVVGLLADRRVAIAVFVLGLSYPLTLYRDIAKLAKASTFALMGMLIIVSTVIIQGFFVSAESRGSFSTPLLTVNGGIFQAIGVISFGLAFPPQRERERERTSFTITPCTGKKSLTQRGRLWPQPRAAFVCHHNSLLIYGSLKTPTMDNFSRVTHYSTGISMLACLAMALAGFLTFGDKTLGNVLNNFPSDNSMVNVARLCFGLNMLTTLPLEAFVCREVMLTYWYPDEEFNLRRHVLFSTGLVVAATAISLLTCDLGVVFELVGATSAVAMAYILPPMCYIKLTTTRSWRTYVAYAVVAFGVAVMVISVIQAIGKMINGSEEASQCI